MKIQGYILKYIILAVIAVVVVIAGFLFVRWLYWDNSSDAALAVFSDLSQDTGVSKYSGNLYINIINTTIPAAKVSYESKYGQKLPNLAASTYSKLFNGMNFDIKDPKTYFSFVFTAFSQYDNEGDLLAVSQDDDDKIPVISNFEDAPEGEIYFSETEEYTAEEAANANGVPTSDILEGSEIANIEDPARLEIEKKQPSILLFHTHSTEAYAPYSNNNYHSLNDKENLIQVGNIMTDVLESKYKFNVIHDVTKHDRYSYADSYINSQKTIISQLEKNKSIKVVLDVHRDAMEAKTERDAKNIKDEYTASINGKNAAKVMLVIGGGNKNYAELQKFAVYIQKKMDKLYPGLFYKIVTKPGKKYNQYYRDHSMLIEVGCTLNTDKEASYSAELMGHVIGEVLKDLNQ
jgi:stage II sporulation protein P